MKRPILGGLLWIGMLTAVPQAKGQESQTVARAANPSRPASVARLANVDEVRKHLGLTPAYDNLPAIERLKVAILDYGFEGVGGPRRYLPEDTIVVEHYEPDFIRRFQLGDPDYRKSFAPLNAHGRMTAQIIWAITGFHEHGPKFHLLNANGPTMLRRAVRYCIENKIDLILFSNTFEGGGNGDGRGPINRVVADALAADIIWINAAGNYGGHVYNGPVDVLPSGYLRLGGGTDQSALRFRNLLDENNVTITLIWNDYREREDAGTDKDLDLYVEDWHGQVVGSSEKRQVVSSAKPESQTPLPPVPADSEESRNPRERIVLTDLPADRDHDYLIRVKAKNGTFTPDDRVRVLITSSREGFLDPKTGAVSEAIQFLDASKKGEIYPPADNPLVLTVGDTGPESAVGPTTDHRRKPDIFMESSQAAFTNGDMTYGASNAAAYFAGVVALMKAAEPGLRTRHLLWFAHQDQTTRVAMEKGPASGVGDDLGARPTSSSTATRRGNLGQRLSNLASSARAQSTGPLQIRAPYFELNRSTLPQSAFSGSSQVVQSFYSPLRIRAGNLEFSLPPRSARGDAREAGGTGTASRPSPEPIHPPRKATEPSPPLAPLVWRTPTREHLAEVVAERAANK
jgi:Subtilase family